MHQQNFKNHVRIPPRPFLIVMLMSLAVIIFSVIKLFSGCCTSGSCLNSNCYIFTMLPLGLMITIFACRRNAIVTQDRAIRAEENLRHFALTGKILDKELKLSQIIALRFASDEEFVNLAQRALKENLTNKQIKEAIQNWRGDYHRV